MEFFVIDHNPGLDELLEKLTAVGGSDMHLKVGSPPAYRIDGVLHPAELPPLSADDTTHLLEELLPERLTSDIQDVNDLDFAYGKAGVGRFRVNVYRQRGSVNIVVRAVSDKLRTLSDLGLPAGVARECEEHSGLIIVTGPTGSGKTTTCAAMIGHINDTLRRSIITLEDPIEVLHRDKTSMISQREVGVDTPSFEDGMKSVLRQDPDVIYVGELRNAETIEAAFVAAETGHLVISTMYTLDATETLNRILDSFPPYLERRMRQMLATSLRAVVSQRLIPNADGMGRSLVAEVLVNTEAVSEKLVETGSIDFLSEIMTEGAFYGMRTIDQAITEKYEAGVISFSDALLHVTSPREFKIAAGAGQMAGG
ncbi:MAG: PilT/PilU family type 4a pilus ATPase [Actinomycetota bacterium]